MGDSGESLIDANSRIEERQDELARERASRAERRNVNSEEERAKESLRLARAELQRQFDVTANERRRQMLAQAIAELDVKMAAMKA